MPASALRLIRIPEIVVSDTKLSSGAVRTYAVLLATAAKEGDELVSHTGMYELARLSGMTWRSVSRFVRQLISRGLIERYRTGGLPSRTVLINPRTIYAIDSDPL